LKSAGALRKIPNGWGRVVIWIMTSVFDLDRT
jgi:hypothetical protein